MVLPGVNDRLEVDQLTPTVFAGVGVLMLCFEVAEKIVSGSEPSGPSSVASG